MLPQEGDSPRLIRPLNGQPCRLEPLVIDTFQLQLDGRTFQHRELARDFDIVLVTPDDARDQLLPAGRLREPLSALARADAVVLMSGAKPEDFPLAGKLIWRVRRGIAPKGLPPKAVAFCGIARRM